MSDVVEGAIGEMEPFAVAGFFTRTAEKAAFADVEDRSYDLGWEEMVLERDDCGIQLHTSSFIVAWLKTNLSSIASQTVAISSPFSF